MVARQFFLYTPFLHFGDIDNQTIQHGLIKNYRVTIKMELGIINPDRATADSVTHDLILFMKIHRAGSPQSEAVKIENYVFWIVRKTNYLLIRIRNMTL